MGRYNKPGINWADIELRWRSGQSMADLARKYGITRQAVQKRARNEGWRQDDPRQELRQRASTGDNEWLPLARETKTAHALREPVTRSEKTIAGMRARSPENLAAILKLIENGVPDGLACHAVGIDPGTLRSWKKDDETVLELVRMAAARALAAKVARIEEAGKRGDWKADAWVLERDLRTREHYGQTKDRSGNDIEVVIHFNREPVPWEGPTAINIRTGAQRPYIEGGARVLDVETSGGADT